MSLNQRLLLTQDCFNDGASYYHLQSLNWQDQWKQLLTCTENHWELEKAQKYTYLSERFLLKFVKKMPI